MLCSIAAASVLREKSRSARLCYDSRMFRRASRLTAAFLVLLTLSVNAWAYGQSAYLDWFDANVAAAPQVHDSSDPAVDLDGNALAGHCNHGCHAAYDLAAASFVLVGPVALAAASPRAVQPIRPSLADRRDRQFRPPRPVLDA